jgi:hypothetical protein
LLLLVLLLLTGASGRLLQLGLLSRLQRTDLLLRLLLLGLLSRLQRTLMLGLLQKPPQLPPQLSRLQATRTGLLQSQAVLPSAVMSAGS